MFFATIFAVKLLLFSLPNFITNYTNVNENSPKTILSITVVNTYMKAVLYHTAKPMYG